MICRNCGATMGDFDTFCPNCGASITTNNYEGNNTDYTASQTVEQPIKTTALLVFSILELCCINPITGLIAVILWATKLKAAVDRGDITEALKTKRIIKIILWVGLALSLVFPLLLMMIIMVPNFSGVQSRMEVRTDVATAAQIGKAARVWYVEGITYPELDYNLDEVEKSFVRVDEINDFENFFDYNISIPSSYKIGRNKEEAAYYVTIINEDDSDGGRFVVAIGPEDLYSAPRKDQTLVETFYENLDYIAEVNYDGSGSGIAYIEP